MTFDQLLTHLPLEEISPVTLFEAAQSRHRALRGLLRVLAQATDVGRATDELLSDAFDGLDMLAADAERLYRFASPHRDEIPGKYRSE